MTDDPTRSDDDCGRRPTDPRTDRPVDGSENRTADRSRLVDHLEKHAVPLERTAPDADPALLHPLGDLFADAAVIGLGEATHGTREFFRCKHRLIRYLVTELDLRVVGFEATYAETIPLDEHVRTGAGDPESALRDLSIWPWKTESVLELVRWLRTFNEGRSADDRVRFHGLDVQHAGPPAEILVQSLDEFASGFPSAHRQTLRELSKDGLVRGPDVPPEDRIERAEAAVDALAGEIGADDPADLPDHVWWCFRTLRQSVDAACSRREEGIEGFSVSRDRAMAANAVRILEGSDHDRIAIWAHNAHVKRTRTDHDWGTTEPMGRVLAHEYEEQYLPFGFDFGSGRFRAIDGRGEGYGDLGTWSLDDPPADSVTGLLAAVEHPVFFLRTDALASDPVLGTWISSDRARRWSGAVYYGDPDEHVAVEVLPDAFDGLIFVDETTPTVPLTDL